MGRFIRLGLAFAFALATGLIASGEALADRRVALVVGNSKYEYADRLANTVNDANAVGALLTNAGFDVVELRRDVGVVEFKRAIRDFLTATSNADIAVVYYSGHGFEIGGVNYLIPVDARLASDFDVQDETIPLDRIIEATQSTKKLSLIILDACRDNPFLRATTRAVASRAVASRLMGVVATGPDTLIAYAARAGSVSFDGEGPNSPFTTALIKYIAEPGVDVRIALGKVRDDVMANTGGRQEPFVYGSLGGGVVSLVPAPAGPSGAVAAPPDDSLATDYAMAERVGSPEAWRAFLAVHASGYYASLARAQLAKTDAAGDPLKSARGDTSRAAGQQAALGADPPRIPSKTPNPPATAEQTCQTAAARLAQLRGNPDEKQLASFARELTCEDLRPQVNRLMESLGIAPADPNQAASLAPASPTDSASSCRHDGDELARLRAHPDLDATKRFARDLRCEALKAQTARLLESLGG